VANPFVHVELNTNDVPKAKAFYGELFDWKLEDMPGPQPYTMIGVGDGTGGGITQHPMSGQPSAWIAYVDVDNVADSTKKAQALGATIIRDVTEIPGYGAFSIIADPTGGVFGLWQATNQ
jgi:uncharacterized protein